MEIFVKFLQAVILGKLPHQILRCLLKPYNYVSNVSKHTKQFKRLKQSRKSATSSISSARLKISTEKAALQALMSALKQKPAVEMKKNMLQAKLERMEMEAGIAASDAKLKVLDNFYEGSESQLTRRGMNE